jgi:RimJ/RimL family protein N-acetyltransferase
VSVERFAIHTARLVLEPLHSGLTERLWQTVLASQDELAPWMAWAVDLDKDDSFRFFRESERDWGVTGWTFGMLLEGEPIGVIGLSRYVPLVGQVDMGYWIGSELAGRGYTTEAAVAVAAFAFDRLGLHRIELNASPDNLGSSRVAEKVGFKREGMRRDGSLGRDGWYDTILYGLLGTDERLHPETISYERFPARRE